MKYQNPIISGYNPDPSICRVGEDYYIVNSSFEYFPGVPIYHSRNLVNWELKGYCLDRDEQLDLRGAWASGGVYAPTLRYHNETFCMITTNVSEGKGHLLVQTSDLSKGWSNPVWVDQNGIDPTLLFEGEDVYFASTSFDERGKQGIFMCRINPDTGEKLEESTCISYGCGGSNPEGPHIYKWFGKYYLLLAEGGTEYGHMVTIQRADSPYGPYEACPHNPILSHRYDTVGDISCTGHADMIEDHNGNWWLVCLGTRASGEKRRHLRLHNLGRETFLSPVTWTSDGWPVVGEDGYIKLEMEGNLPGESPVPVCNSFYDDFSEPAFSDHYNFLRNPRLVNYTRDCDNQQLILNGTSVTLNDMASPTWLGVKQKEFAISAEAEVKPGKISSGGRVGLTAFYNDSYHYEIYLTKEGDEYQVCLAKHIHDLFVVTTKMVIPVSNWIKLKITSDREYYYFSYSVEGQEEKSMGKGSTAGLATEGTMTMTFTGTYIGMFAENGTGIFREFKVG